MDPDVEARFKDIESKLSFVMQRRITQYDVVPDAIKQRAVGEGVRFIASGIEADLPTTAPATSTGTAIYFATDTGNLFCWDGAAWLSVMLT